VTSTVLGPSDLDQFTEEGYVRLSSAFSRTLAGRCRQLACEQLGIDETDPKSWVAPVVRGLVEGQPLHDAANSPRLLDAVHQLLDPDRWQDRPDLGAFVVRFPTENDPGDSGWHIDGSFERQGSDGYFVNYRSRGRGLLLLCLLSDVGIDDAPTRVLPGSHLKTAQMLRSFGDAGSPNPPLPDQFCSIALATGEAGDVYLCHPFLVHAASWPHRGTTPRFISQPPIGLSGALQLDGEVSALSVVARTIRRSLDQSRLDRD
jgi:Phytanoyl-CoA dioxygenase (PhyH)